MPAHKLTDLHLSAAVATHGHTAAIKDGGVRASGISLDFVDVGPQIAAYRRMVRGLEFDVCELAPTTYLAAREAGVPMTALPVLLNRNFHHGDTVCRPGSGIQGPKDLENRRFGVRAYSVTTGVWVRGILRQQYGVDLSRVKWVVDDEEHVESMRLPPNVEHTPAGASIAQLFLAGEIDAAVKGAAGIGRAGAATQGWESGGIRDDDEGYYELLADKDALERNWYRDTGIYPFHGLVVVRDEVLNEHPWVAGSLFEAFEESKARFLPELQDGGGDEQYRRLMGIVGDDPLPYGLEANRTSIEALIGFARDQEIIHSTPRPEDVFAGVV